MTFGRLCVLSAFSVYGVSSLQCVCGNVTPWKVEDNLYIAYAESGIQNVNHFRLLGFALRYFLMFLYFFFSLKLGKKWK